MLSTSFTFESLEEIKTQQSALEQFNPSLIILYAAPAFFKDNSRPTERLSTIIDDLSHITANIVGCSTAGEVNSDQVSNDTIVMIAMKFEYGSSVEIHSSTLTSMQNSFDTGEKLGQHIKPAGLKGIYALAPGLAINGSALIHGLANSLSSDVKISGGLAGDNASFEKTYVISPQGIREDTVVAVCFYGDNLSFGYGASGGWRSFGPSRSVTKAKENVLYELDNAPALAIYKEYLGEYAADLPANGLLFPLEVIGEDQKGSGLIRTILGINEEDGSLILAGDVEEMQYVRLMHASTDNLIDGAQLAVSNALTAPNSQPAHSVALVTSCVGRKLVMGDRVEEELECVQEHLPTNTCIAGFYSYGEICPFNNQSDSKLYNQTMSMTLIQEATS